MSDPQPPSPGFTPVQPGPVNPPDPGPAATPTATPTAHPSASAPAPGVAITPAPLRSASAAAGPAPAASAASASASPPKESVKETLILLIIAFVLAFVFRGFVVEAFVIPTGSMAPTLMGAHLRFRGEQSGHTWPVGPWSYIPGTTEATPVQGVGRPVVVHDPMTGEQRSASNVPTRAGDRILVLKYLYALREPSRFDVVVFKYPGEPATNYIKRLIGLPGEQVALIDGDVFVRRGEPDPAFATAARGKARAVGASWREEGWRIARKPAHVARAVWQRVADTRYAPRDAAAAGPAFRPPWTPADPATGAPLPAGAATGAAAPAPDQARDQTGAGWDLSPRRHYVYRGTAPAALAFDASSSLFAPSAARGPAGLNDRYAFNEGNPASGDARFFPVADVRVGLTLEPAADDARPRTLAVHLLARGHELVGRIEPTADGAQAVIAMRPLGPDGRTPAPDAAWTILDQRPAKPLAPGRTRDVEFWHLDQSVQLWIDGTRVAYGEYDWSPAQRLAAATGMSLDDALRSPGAANPLAEPSIYRPATLRITLDGGPITLRRVFVDRDLHLLPTGLGGPGGTLPAWCTHPASTIALADDHYFVCGDNSPASVDGRLWTAVDPWAAESLDPTVGIVPRRMMLGKAFFVYFPALAGNSPVPMPDFGRLRFID